jgi:RNA polymerase sigma factor (TIGR02999 family)
VEPKPHEITLLLRQWRTGDRDAEGQLFELLMPDLHRMAARYFRSERAGHTLQTTALVNEGFLRLAASKNVDFQDRGHFLAIAALIMRRCLINHARGRPNAYFLPLEGIPEGLLATHTPLELAVAIDTLIEEMGTRFPQRRNIVELKFFLGMTDDEAAEALGMAVHTLQRDWYQARRWLFERLSDEKWKAARNETSAS